MAMGKRRRRGRHDVGVQRTVRAIRSEHVFSTRRATPVEEQPFYADGVGRPSLAPGRYAAARLLRGAGLGTCDCVAGRRFAEPAAVPRRVARRGAAGPLDGVAHGDGSLSRRTWRSSQRLADAGLVGGKTVGIDATSWKPMRRFAAWRRDTGAGYETFLRQLAAASGSHADARRVGPPGPQAPEEGVQRRLDHPKDPDAKITKMKDGRTRLAHKAEHAVDLETGAVVGVCPGRGCRRPQTMLETPPPRRRAAAGPGIAELVCDIPQPSAGHVGRGGDPQLRVGGRGAGAGARRP